MSEMDVQGGMRVCRGKTGQLGNKGVCVVVRPRTTAAVTMRPRPPPPPTTFKKVEIVYYLSRNNGHLEHPHYMEVTHLSHQQLRLKDFMDRLTVLRGKGMPSLYSWSCKRSYKNGYVWNDLAENDVICPSQGAEYVLKGSELLFHGSNCSDKLHHLQMANNVQPKCTNSLASKRRNEHEAMSNNNHNYDHHHGEEEEEEEEEELKEQESHKNGSSDLLLSSFSSPPSATSSSISDKANNDTITNNISNNNNNNNNNNSNNNTSMRFEDGDEPLMSRNSMLLSLIACGGSASFRKTVPPPAVKPPPPPPCTTGRKSGGGHKVAVKMVVVEEDSETVIGRISENPRFGKLHAEEKEYFSGSIVESITMERSIEPGLKKSSSHNEERSKITGFGEVTDEEVEREKGFKGRCIPRKKSSSKHSKD